MLVATDLQTANGLCLSFSLGAGSVLAVTGASGSGKTLLLRALADLDPVGGQVTLNGRACADGPGWAWRAQVTMVPAESAFWAPTLRDHLREDPGDLPDRLGLGPELLDAPVERLSTGERQRGALLRALLIRPAVLLLDEPTGPLDPATTTRVEAVLQDFVAQGGAIVLVTHDPAQAKRLRADRLELTPP